MTERKDGTSSATPTAAGVAALFIEYCRTKKSGEAGSHQNMLKLFPLCPRILFTPLDLIEREETERCT
jgi:hypothetical protein